MNVLHHWLGFRLRRDWSWNSQGQRPSLKLNVPIRPGWYLLTVRIQSEQLRCYGLFNGSQGRILVSGKLRKRLVRVCKGHQICHFELQGLNGQAQISTLRLVPQPFWRVRHMIAKKLLNLHPAYSKDYLAQQPFLRQWQDYNRLLSRRSFNLVGYDEWIERVEGKIIPLEPYTQPVTFASRSTESSLPDFAIWLWGERDDEEQAQQSIASVEQQLPGPYTLLAPDHHLEKDEQSTWVVMLQVGDQLAPRALNRFAAVIQNHQEACVLYADEDQISPAGRRHSPQFKPAWNPDLLYSDPHYSHIWVIRADHCYQACEAILACGEEPTLYALALEATANCEANQIFHLPGILYHRLDTQNGSRSSRETTASLESFFARHGKQLHVTFHPSGGHVVHWPLPDPPPLVSIIIPTRNHGDLLHCCLSSLAEHGQGNPPTEIIVIDNGSSEIETLNYLATLERHKTIRVLRRPGQFNYAALNNEAVFHAKGELIALMNNDVEATHPGWLATMAAQALRPEIGAVGAKLLFEDGTVQHGGVLLGIGGIAGHAHKYLDAGDEGYQLRLQLTHNLSAVTGAMLVIRKSVFQEVGGFDAENFAVNYNDVDLCLRLMVSGYRNLFCPEAVLVHHESKTRGAPTAPDAYAQWKKEQKAMLNRWGDLLTADPNYSPYLTLQEENLSLSLRPTILASRLASPLNRIGHGS